MSGDGSAPTQGWRAVLIVLNYEGAGVIRACLDSLAAAVGPDDRILVVDNASTDGSADIVERDYPDVLLVRRAENNFIFGLNDGLRAAPPSEFVAFLNNDIVAEPGYVERAIAGFDADDVFAVCPRILDRDGNEQGSRTAGFWKHGLIFYKPLPHVEDATNCFFAVGGQSFFCRAYLDEIGSIDELLYPMYHEDIELSYRAWKRGWRIRYAPDSVIHHVGGHSSNRRFTPQQLRSFVRQNEFLTVWKDVTDRRMLAEHVALLPVRLGVAAVKRDWATLVGFWHALQRLPRVRPARRRAKRSFELSDREALRRVSTEAIASKAS